MSDTAGFPADLLDLQRRWYAAEAAWAADPAEEHRLAFAEAGAQLYAHPYWATAGNRHKAVMELKQAARPQTEPTPAA
ncbi:hypothetical protein OG196_43015 (plasmid) [Kitasatospora purpeofusca]|uniref:hypothetical protein n=1 Tax=Kitasatospora purpeofusca TaxID=67352 RepID=UPI002E0FA7C0|nr:hypothetical protein OG196_43015 [Kitasatospora purpeofusca]